MLQEIQKAQQEDPFAQQAKQELKSRMENSEDLAPCTSSFTRKASPFANISVENGWLKRKGKIYVPSAWELRAKVLQENHDSPCAGHLGFDKIIQLVRWTVWLLHLNRDVRKYVQQCFQCQVIKTKRVKSLGLLHPLPIPKSNFHGFYSWITKDSKTKRYNFGGSSPPEQDGSFYSN